VETIVLVIAIRKLAYSGLLDRKSVYNEPPVQQQDISAGLAEMNFREVVMTKGADSPGQVTFNHATHVDMEKPACADCHSQRFRILKTTALPAKIDMHDEQHCGSCHDGKKTSFNVTEDCETCHSGQ
jgi:c(7)-type cytochrome triheme protein